MVKGVDKNSIISINPDNWEFNKISFFRDKKVVSKKVRMSYLSFIIISIFILCLYSVLAINYGDPSPDTGEADQGIHIGTFSAQGGSYTDTGSNNNIYFSVERANNGAISINQSLSFNVSILSKDSSLKIIGINGSLAYCHSRRITSNCAGGAAPQGTPGRMTITILNVTSGIFVDVGNLTPTFSNNIKTVRNWNVTATTNYSQYVNSSGFITVRFGFAWSGTGRASFLDDHANLTIIYDSSPVVTLSSPANGTVYTGVSNVSLRCNATDNSNLFNITLYHNINGTYAANKTVSVRGTSNSTQFNFTNVPIGNYTWNCQASDNVLASVFAPKNFTFTIADNIKPGISFAEPTPTSGTNQTSPSVLVNTSVYDLHSGISACNLDFDSTNTTMTKSGGGANISCYLNRSSLADGAYSYRVYATDTVGNLNVSATRRITIDTTGPVITFVAPTDNNGNTVSRNNTFVNLTITDLTEVTLCILDMDGSNSSMTKFGNGSNVNCYLNKSGLSEGTHTYRVYANDTLGNMAVTSTMTVTVSTIISTPPTISFIVPTDADNAIVSRNSTMINVSAISTGYNVSSCTLDFNGTNSTMNFSVSNNGLSVTCYFNKTNLIDGNYAYIVYANDTQGSFSTSGSRGINIDATGPALTFVDPTPVNADSLALGSFTINTTSIDTFGSISSCTLDFNGVNETMTVRGSGTSVSCRSIKSSITGGSYYYIVYSNDSANNLGASQKNTLTIDISGPNVTLVNPTPGSGTNQTNTSVYINTTVTHGFANISSCTLDFGGSNFTMNISSTGTNDTSCFYNYTGLSDGSYSYRVYANDSGNNLNVSSTRTLTVDTTGPVVTFVFPSYGGGATIANNNTFVNVTVTDALETTLCILDMDGSNTTMTKFGNGTSVNCYLNSTGLADGTHTYRVYANDSLGNLGVSATRTIIISTILPSILFLLPSDPTDTIVSRNNTLINVSVISQSLSISDCILDFNGTNSTMTLSGSGLSVTCYFNKTNLIDGNYTYRVYANDSSNGLGISALRTIIIDSTSPNITFVSPTPANSSNLASDFFTINATSIDTFSSISSCTLDFNGTNETMTVRGSGTSVSCMSIKSLVVSGNYYYIVYSNDSLDNIVATQKNILTIDLSGPNISFVDPTPGSGTNQTNTSVYINTTVTHSFANISSCTLDFGGSNFTMNISGTGSNLSCFYNYTSLSDGTYSYRVYAYDIGGNVNVSSTRTLTLDTTGPVITFVDPTDGNGAIVSRNNTLVNVTVTDALETTLCILDMDGSNTTMTKFGNGTSVNCYLNSTGLSDGTHTYRVYANGILGNLGVSATRTLEVSTVIILPSSISFIFPSDNDGASVSRSNTYVNVSVSSLSNNISSCTLNFNGTNSTMILFGSGQSVTCYFNKTGLADGNYNYIVYANDTTDKTGLNSQTIIIDTTSPVLSIVDPTPDDGTNSSTGSFTVNITSIDEISSIGTCILDLNGTNETMTVRGTGNNVSCRSIETLSAEGTYSYRAYSNDSLGNLGVSETRIINIDILGPNITFDSLNPVDNYNSSSDSVSISATAIDNVTLISTCILDFNGTNYTMSLNGIGKGVTCSSTQSSLVGGLYSYKVYSNDSSGNLNVSETRNLIVDLDFPYFISLTTEPADDDSLDPGFVINLTANVTDNTTLISTVILQYKLNTSSTYDNMTMTYNSSLRLYNASFNASIAGGYNLRLIANDSANNVGFSNTVNISVLLENTWARSPNDFSSISANINQSVSLGILILNNTGDSTLNFSVSSDYVNTSFNVTFPVSLNTSEIKRINVTATAPANNSVTKIVLTINASPDATPLEQTTNVSLVVSDDAFLSAMIDTYPSSVTQGDTIVSLSATLKNIGHNNATDVYFYYILPDGWNVTAGSQNLSIGNLSVDETATSTIEVSIGSNVSTGNQVVTVNSTGLNRSGVDLSGLGKIKSNSVSITVNAISVLGSQSVESSTGNVISREFGGSVGIIEPSNIYGGYSSTGGAIIWIPSGEAIHKPIIIRLASGSSGDVPILISNLYENSILEDIQLELSGLLSQYIKVTPIIDYNKQIYVETEKLEIVKIGVPLTINLLGIGNHTITANSIKSDSFSFTLHSNINNLTLFLGQKKPVDLDNDNKSDIVVYLRDIVNGNVSLVIYKLGSPNPNRLYFGEERNYSLSLFAPPDLQGRDFNLTLKITANIVAIDPNAAGFISKPLVEYRRLRLSIIQSDDFRALELIDKAGKSLGEMSEAGFPTMQTNILLSQAKSFYSNGDYLQASEFASKIIKNTEFAFKSDKLIRELQLKINSAQLKLLDTSKSEKSLAVALNAFSNEDFEMAFNLATGAEIVFINEIQGKFSFRYILAKYWLFILLVTMFLVVGLFWGMKRIKHPSLFGKKHPFSKKRHKS